MKEPETGKKENTGKSGYSITTWRLHLWCRHPEWLRTTQEFYNRIAEFYYNLLLDHTDLWEMGSQQTLRELEIMSIPGRGGRIPSDPLPWQKVPLYFRRAAANFIHATFVRRGWEKYSWLGMLIYYLCFYSFSLNLLRQSIAMSIIFWGYNYIVERKPIKFCVSVVIAAGFHLTAAIMLLLYPIHRMVTYVQDKDSKNIFSRIIGPYRKLIYALIILLCVAVLFLYSSLLPIIIALTGRFEGQLEFLSGGISMYWPYWLIMSLPIFLLFRRYNVRRSMDEEYSFLYLMFALSIILFQVIGINSESYRISLYFMQFLILLMVKSGCTEYQTFRIILERWCILIFLGAYYVYFFIIALFNHVYPYTSSMLGI